MASSAKHFSLLILLTLLLSLRVHARESQFFNKVPGGNNNNVVEETKVPREPLGKQEESPSFIPQTENSYGLYGHESGQHPPTTTNLPYKPQTEEPFNKAVLPANYNPVAYVTKPEGYKTEAYENEPQGMNDANLPKNYNTAAYVTQPQGISNTNLAKNYNTEAYETEPQGMNDAGLPKNYNTEAYVTQPRGIVDTRLINRDYTSTPTRGNSYYNGKNSRFPFQQQGMSDTRFLENGKYYYDINNERHSRNPYENEWEMGSKNGQSNTVFYGNNENSYEYSNNKSMQRFQNEEDQLQDSQDEYPWP